MCPILARYNLLYFKIKPINYVLNYVYNEGCTFFVVIYGGIHIERKIRIFYIKKIFKLTPTVFLTACLLSTLSFFSSFFFIIIIIMKVKVSTEKSSVVIFNPI